MKRITAIIVCAMQFWSSAVFSAPYKCGTGQIFADRNQCDSFCSGESGGSLSCSELDSVSSGSPCNMSKYQGFVYSDGKTFAVTKAAVAWDTEKNTAIIRNGVDNAVIARMLSTLGISAAWIGAHDPDKSTDYNNINPSRFVWRDGSPVSYSNWGDGEPNNAFPPEYIGRIPLYGEYWAAIFPTGKWNDYGYTPDASGGSIPRLPAVVEFPGQLSCVSGTEKQPATVPGLSGMACTGQEDAEGIAPLIKCKQGLIFGTSNTGALCQEGKAACKRSEETVNRSGVFQMCTDHIVLGRLVRTGNKVNVEFKGGRSDGSYPFYNCPVNATAQANGGWYVAETFNVPSDASDIKLNYSIPTGNGCSAGNGEAYLPERPCDTNTYRGFTYVNGKTFAVTKANVNPTVLLDPNNILSKIAGIIRSQQENDAVARMKSALGLGRVSIGLYDPKPYGTYPMGVRNPDRFIWRDGTPSKETYTNWDSGEPNNSVSRNGQR